MKYGARASRPHHKQIERAICALPCVDKTTLTFVQSCGFSIETVTTDGGLNLENLMGRNIKSDILDAYAKHETAENSDLFTSRKTPFLRNTLKNLIKSAIITPLFYKTFKVGIRLTIIARKN